MNTRTYLGIGDTIEWANTSWNLAALTHNHALLVEMTDPNNVRLITLQELYRAVPPTQSAKPFDPRANEGKWPDCVLDMAKHVQEVFYGTAMDDPNGPSRPQFDPAHTTTEQRIAAKVAELAGTSTKTSRPSLYRYRDELEHGGMAALARRMLPPSQLTRPLNRLAPEVIVAIDDVLAARTRDSTRSKGSATFEVRQIVREKYPNHPEFLDCSDRTLRRYINERAAGLATFKDAKARQSKEMTPDRMYEYGRVLRPGQRVELDSTPVNVLVKGDDGKPYRPILTMLLDVATKVPVAWHFRPHAPNAQDHALLLARAIVPRKSLPGHEATRLAAAASLPVETMKKVNHYLDDDSLALPYIFPEEITIDGGADFRGTVFESACRHYGVTLNLAAPYSPTTKSHVERWFGTFDKGFCEWMPGYVGNSPENRGKNVEPVLSLAALETLFDVWVTTVYLHTPSKGLRDPHCAKVKRSPAQQYAAVFEMAAGLPIPYSKDDFLNLLSSKTRTIQPQGIELNNRFYDARGLEELRNAPGPEPKGRWRVFYDRYAPSSVWVFNPFTQEWVEARDRTLNFANTPMVYDASEHLTTVAGQPSDEREENRRAFVDTVRLLTTTAEKEERANRRQARRLEAARQDARSDLPRPRPTMPTQPDIVEAATATEQVSYRINDLEEAL